MGLARRRLVSDLSASQYGAYWSGVAIVSQGKAIVLLDTKYLVEGRARRSAGDLRRSIQHDQRQCSRHLENRCTRARCHLAVVASSRRSRLPARNGSGARKGNEEFNTDETPAETDLPEDGQPGISDVRSGSERLSLDGTAYADW